MTTLGSLEVEEYSAAVRAELADLGPEQVAELTEDLGDHLAEVLAEGDGTLLERLGPPETYAVELRAAAGLAPRDPDAKPPREDLFTRAAATARRADLRIGELFGARRFVDVLATLQPAWWLLRGWIVAEWICDRGHWDGIVPQLGSYGGAGGLLVLLVCMAVSVLIGARVRVGPNWLRVASGVASTFVALWGAVVLSGASSNAADVGYTGYVEPVVSYGDLYVYDGNGNLVPNARIYDQDGNPVNIADGYCQYGDPNVYGPQTGDGAYTYPICANDPGPFRSGPGVVPSQGNALAPTATPSGSTTPGPTTSTTSPSLSPAGSTS